MKRALDAGNVRESLRHASQLCTELRTGRLEPRHYYELYMNCTDELRELQLFFDEEHTKHTLTRQQQGGGGNQSTIIQSGHSIVEFYETVQHCGNVINRLYLLITVAAVFLKVPNAPIKSILFDLVELCRGVQQPTRGLFLRNYLSSVTKGVECPELHDTIAFITLNFSEMNRLWVRMQHQGAVRDKSRREKQRRNLRQLVGINLVRLSELQGVTLEVYSATILPKLCEIITECKDVLSQEYLMDCLIQVFPDTFHLATLEKYLDMCTQLTSGVDVKAILIALMDRLSNYATIQQQALAAGGGAEDEDDQLLNNNNNRDDAPPDQLARKADSVDMFALFARYSSNVIQQQAAAMPLLDILQLQVALLRFTSTVYETRHANIDAIYRFCVETLRRHAVQHVTDSQQIQCIVELLTLPLQALQLVILQLDNYGALLACLDTQHRKQVAMTIMRELLLANVTLDSVDKVETLFGYLSPVLRDDGATAAATAAAAGLSSDELRMGGVAPMSDDLKFEFEQEQHLVVRLFHRVRHASDTDIQFALLATSRKWFGQGGVHRIEHTLPALVMRCLQLVEQVQAREQQAIAQPAALTNDATSSAVAASSPTGSSVVDSLLATAIESPKSSSQSQLVFQVRTKKLFGFLHETISVLTPHYPESALRLFLHSAVVADKCRQEPIAYEFVAQAFIAYEDEISDSRHQYAAILLLIGLLQQMHHFTSDNFDTLVSKATQHAAKLLRKADQCRAVAQCAHLFWTSQVTPVAPPEVLSESAAAAAAATPALTDSTQQQSDAAAKSESDEKSTDDKTKDESSKDADKTRDSSSAVVPANAAANAAATAAAASRVFVHCDAARVLACLQRSLKIANTCVGLQVELFCEILNKYLWFYDRDCPSVTVKYLKGLIQLIDEHARQLDRSESSNAKRQFIANTMAHIRMKAQQDQPGYAEIAQAAEGV